MSNDEIKIDELIKRILDEEEFVKSQVVNYSEYLPEFILKVLEDVEIIETKDLLLEKDLQSTEVINSLCRSFHNIKRISAFIDDDAIQRIAHKTQTLMDGCLKGITKPDKNIIDLILKSTDYIKQICLETSLNEDEDFLDQIFTHIINLEDQENNNLDQIIEGSIPVKEEDNTEFFKDFVIEAKEHLSSLESNSIELEKNLDDIELMHSIFRDLHSIKGLAGFAGQTYIQRITHQTETLIDGGRKGKLKITLPIINFLLITIDYIKKICENLSIVKDSAFLKEVDIHLNQMENEEKIAEEQVIAEEVVDDEFLQDFILEAKEHIENIESQVIYLEKEPSNEEIIHSMFRSFHTIKGLAGFVNQNLIQKIAHQTETIMDSCKKGKVAVDKALIDLILASSDYINKICSENNLVKDREFIVEVNSHLQVLEYYELTRIEATNNSNKKIGEILVEQRVIDQQEVQKILEKQKESYPDLKFGQVMVKEEKANPSEIIKALKTQQTKHNIAEEYMRVSTTKVDSLVDMVGELIIAQSLIEQYTLSNHGGDSFFNINLGRMTRITKDLQNLSMFLRMVSLKSTFQKITRIARDTINELGKNIDFTTSGDETEIDRIVTEKLLDPLVHLVKNSIAHGIETQEERFNSGKSEKGNVRVSAYNKRGSIYIEISDDGKGIDIEKVYKKAVEKGLADLNKQYTEKEIQEFILLPGFSTLEVANNISGRGVGMDVVKTEMSKIGGKIEINSIKGQGCTFILKIPVNHAVLNGTIVDIEGSNYIIPTINVKQILQPKEEQWVSVQGTRSMIKVREDIIPLISISELFRTNKKIEEPKLLVIIELDHKYKALPVRNVIGRQEIVVKPAGDQFSKLKYVSGMSILGDGKVSLILDIEHLYVTEGAN